MIPESTIHSGIPPMNRDLQDRLELARTWIIERYQEPLRLGDIASACFLSPYHFHRLYRSRFHETPLMTITRTRLEQGMRLLREGELSVGEICLEVGYASQTTFARFFQAATNLSPTAYRQLHRTPQDRRGTQEPLPDTIYHGMKANLSHATLYVKNQDAALDFYVNKLGFEVCSDITIPEGFRWLTVAPRTQVETEVVLFPIGAMGGMTDETASAFHKVLESGHMGGLILQVPDCRAAYKDLLEKGVEFDSEPTQESYGLQAIFKDDSGNRHVLAQTE
jgi:AraC-like DNA-binding protein/catechol 2,3-dioxygenase-like lactoylglutathione lyase family enzyme